MGEGEGSSGFVVRFRSGSWLAFGGDGEGFGDRFTERGCRGPGGGWVVFDEVATVGLEGLFEGDFRGLELLLVASEGDLGG